MKREGVRVESPSVLPVATYMMNIEIFSIGVEEWKMIEMLKSFQKRQFLFDTHWDDCETFSKLFWLIAERKS